MFTRYYTFVIRADTLQWDEATIDFAADVAAWPRLDDTENARVLGLIAGFCIAHIERARKGIVTYVVTLDVAPACRRQGLARQMMQSIEQQARDAGCEAVELHVWVDNAAAIAFYEREGYERSHIVKSFYGLGRHAYVYRKALEIAARHGEEWAAFLKA